MFETDGKKALRQKYEKMMSKQNSRNAQRNISMTQKDENPGRRTVYAELKLSEQLQEQKEELLKRIEKMREQLEELRYENETLQ